MNETRRGRELSACIGLAEKRLQVHFRFRGDSNPGIGAKRRLCKLTTLAAATRSPTSEGIGS